jgi:hypothetical protein
MPDDQRARIRALNDQLRHDHTTGRVLVTVGVTALGRDAVRDALRAVADFTEFGPRNDPYEEHDFGAFELRSQQLFWKIDYYDPSLSGASLDPADESRCVRVLTIMLAEEY